LVFKYHSMLSSANTSLHKNEGHIYDELLITKDMGNVFYKVDKLIHFSIITTHSYILLPVAEQTWPFLSHQLRTSVLVTIEAI